MSQRSPSAARVAAGKRNRLLRGPITPEGRERLRQAALTNRPWLASTGPKSPEGKARSARNGKTKGVLSVRALRALTTPATGVLDELRRARGMVAGLLAGQGG